MNAQRQVITLEQQTLPTGLAGFERFNLALQAERQLGDTIKCLQEAEAELAQLSASHQHEVEKALSLQDQVHYQELEAATYRDSLSEMQNTILALQERIREQDSRLMDANNVITGVRSNFERQKVALKLAQDELKTLRALNPEKLQRQVKRIKDKNAELLTSNNVFRTKNTELEKSNIQLSKSNTELLQENTGFTLALNKAVSELNEGPQQAPVSTHGDFAVFADKDSHTTLHIEDTKTGISRPYHGDSGVPKTRPIPPAVLEDCQARIKSNIKVMKRLEKYDA
ncbi:MAG: hypothetical protein ACKVJE_17170 [Pseudomonadales bacterium]